MGLGFSRLKRNRVVEVCAGSMAQIITGRKRKRDDDQDDFDTDLTSVLENSNTPKKKKLKTTTQYIYQALFKEHKNYDISVMALRKVWHLHKVYLCQSNYFASMFGGSWRETEQSFINIEIIDPKINIEALDTVFGSLYLDEITIDPKSVISVMATATLFQLEGLIVQCAEVMVETVNAETAIPYYETSTEYGVQSVQNAAFNWLLTNLLSFYAKQNKWLQQINVDLMQQLIRHPDLFVLQTECSLYLLLRYWLYVKLHEHCTDGVTGDTLKGAKYFADIKEKVPFLNTEAGKPYVKAFRGLRLQHLMNHPIDFDIILNDNIVPKNWLHEPLLQKWSSLLKIDQSMDNGPTELDPNLFLDTCVRCGRILLDPGFQKWRWTSFNFGLDLVFITDSQSLSIKRHHRTEPERLLSLQSKRDIIVRVTISSINEQRQVRHSQKTDIKYLSLEKNEESLLLYFDKELCFPLLVSVNVLVVSPVPSATNESVENDTEQPIANLGSLKAYETDNASLEANL